MAGKNLEVLLKVRDLASAQLKKFDSSAKTSTRSVGILDRRMKRLSATSSTLRRNLTGVFAGLSAAIAVRSMVRTISGFEQAMATVRGVTKATGEEFEALNAKARELGATTVFTGQQAAEGLLFLARAGFDTQESLAAIDATLDLAVAGAIDLGRAADIASNSVKQFNLSAAETVRVVDVFVQTTNSANTDVEQLAQAMKLAGPVAGALGQSIENTAAAIGALGDAGIQGSLAGTSLRGTMAALLQPTDKAFRALDRLNIELSEVDPATKTITQIFERFSRGQLDAAAAVAIFGRRQAAGALVMAQSTDKIRELTEANEKAAGEAERMANIMQDTLAGSFKALTSAVQELFLATGDAGLTGTLRGMIDTMTEATRILAGMEGAAEKASDSAKLLAESLKAVGIAIAGIVAAQVLSGLATLAVRVGQIAAAAKGLFVLLNASPFAVLATTIGAIGSSIISIVRDMNSGASEFEEMIAAENAAFDAAERAERATSLSAQTIGFFGEAVDKTTGEIKTLNSALTEEVIAIDKAKDRVDNFITSKKNQLALLKVEGVERELLAAKQKLTKDLMKLEVADRAELELAIFQTINAIDDEKAARDRLAGTVEDALTKANRELAEKKKLSRNRIAAQTVVNNLKAALDRETRAVEMGADASVIAARVKLFENAARRASIPNLHEEVQAYKAELVALQNLNKEAEKRPAARIIGTDGASAPRGFFEGYDQLAKSAEQAGDRMARMGDATSNALFNAFQVNFFDPMTGQFIALEELGKQVFSSLMNALSQYLAQEAALAIVKGVSGGLSGLFGGGSVINRSEVVGKNVPLGAREVAKGAVFNQGREIVPFARGGVVGGPTTFPIRGGRTGLMGEAGPEAIVPLHQGSRGLGIDASGMGNVIKNELNMTFSPTIHAQDSTGVRDELQKFLPQVEAVAENTVNKMMGHQGFRRAMQDISKGNS